MYDCLSGDVGTCTRSILDDELLPDRSDSHWPISLAVMSDDVPGGKPTMMRAGRDG
jgi:hypothetical protein